LPSSPPPLLPMCQVNEANKKKNCLCLTWSNLSRSDTKEKRKMIEGGKASLWLAFISDYVSSVR
jgi:hypothetical protein